MSMPVLDVCCPGAGGKLPKSRALGRPYIDVGHWSRLLSRAPHENLCRPGPLEEPATEEPLPTGQSAGNGIDIVCRPNG